MNSRSTWTLFCSALVLLALILLVERPIRKSAGEMRQPLVFPKLKPSAVSGIRLRWRGQAESVLVRSNEQWFLAAPLRYPADSDKVNRFLDGLAALEWQSHLSAVDLKDRTNVLEEFGFASPLVSLRLDEGGYDRQLLVGAATALGDEVSAQIVGGDGFYLVGAGLLSLLPADFNALRDRRLVQWTPKLGDRIKVSCAPGTYELELNQTNHLWSMVWPLASRADNQKIAALLSDLHQLRVERFVSDDPAPDLDSFGLQTPVLRLLFGAGTNYHSGLELGASPTNEPGLAWVRRPNSPGVFLVAKTNLEPWMVSLSEFRDHHIVTLATNEIALIEINGADNFRVRRDKEGRWRVLTAAGGFPADRGMVEGMLASLSRIEVSLLMAVVTDYSTYGLTSPPLRLLLWRDPDARTNSPPTEIDFGAVQAGRVFVRRTDESAVNSISLEEFSKFPRASWQLRDRHIWSFQTSDVTSITISQKGEKLRLVHGRNNEWSIAPGYQGFINTDSVQEGVARLGALEAVFWAGRGEDATDQFGLKETDHEIELDVRQGSTVRELTIRFGRASPFQNPYARVMIDGEPWFFEFPWQLYREFIATDLSIHPVPGQPRR